jgi:predicted nucleic acid-binding protein
MASVLARRERSGNLTPVVRKRALNNFLLHARRQYVVIELNDRMLKEARSLLIRQRLRSLDALQLASAIVAERELGIKVTFVSADGKLLPAAAAEGFTTDDPNLHP